MTLPSFNYSANDKLHWFTLETWSQWVFIGKVKVLVLWVSEHALVQWDEKKALLTQKISKHGIWNEKPSMALTIIIYYLINFSFPRSQMKKERRHKEKIQKVHDKMLLGQVITIQAINWFSIYPSLGCYRCFIFERISWTISTEWWGPFIWTGNYIYNDVTNGWYVLTKGRVQKKN